MRLGPTRPGRAQETHVTQAPENCQRNPIEHADGDAQSRPTRAPRFPMEKAKGMARSVMTTETNGKETLELKSTLNRVVSKPIPSISAVYFLSSPKLIMEGSLTSLFK